jgi:predicted Zn-dependent peptidase
MKIQKSKLQKSRLNKSRKYSKKNSKKEMKLYKNHNGTKLLVMPNRTETATASIYFFFKVGSKNETKTNNGVSHFIEHLIFKGSPKYPNYLDISKTFDANGISFNAYTSKDTTAYHYKFLSTKENLDIICKITSDMIMNPFMREKDIKTERNVIVQEYNDDLDDIDEYIAEKIEECLLDGHPLGRSIIGTLKTINDIDRKEIVDYHKKYYRPDNLTIGFSGCMYNDYLPLIENYFGGAKTYRPISLNEQGTTEIIPFVDKHPKFEIDCFPKDLKQDYIHIIFKTKGYFDPMKIYYKMLVNILGGNMSSRLFVEIREKLGLVYSIKCDTTTYEEIGYFDIYTQNETKDTLKCIDAIFKELVKIKEHLVSETELKENKKNYCDIYKTNFDDIEYEIEHYSRQVLLNRPVETLDMRINSIQNITPLDIQNASREIFNFNKAHIITFGKVKKSAIEKVITKYCNN